MTDFLSKILFYFLSFIAGIIPVSIARKLSVFAGSFFYFFVPIRKSTASINIKKCFPLKDDYWRKDILKKAYVNLMLNLCEFFYFTKINSSNINSFIISKNPELFKDALKSGKSVILASGHFSNWEMNAYTFPYIYGVDLKILAKKQTNDGLNNLINSYREKSGNKVIQTGFSLREIYKLIKENNVLAFLIDQSAHSNSADYVKFFGTRVASFNGVSKLALKYNSIVIFAYAIRNEDYTYTQYLKEIDYTGLTQIEISQKLQSELQRVIEQYPSQWVWFHKRFKHTIND